VDPWVALGKQVHQGDQGSMGSQDSLAFMVIEDIKVKKDTRVPKV
jgi:hypothetical protein